jgi:hypothetical protein
MRYTEVVEATRRVLEEYSYRLTVRQIYYRLISPPYQLFPNTATNYKTFDKILTKARERKEVDWSILGGEQNIFDSPEGYMDWLFGGLNERYYDKSHWKSQLSHVEVWVEKDALSTLFERAVKQYRIVVFPSRGYSSYTKVMEALERFPQRKNVVILHFGDHDPSGLDMSRDLSSRLDAYSDTNDGGLVVKRIALGIEQVKGLALPPNPTKKADSRAREYTARYGDECWELDAVPPDTLAQWVRDAVEREIDSSAWIETQERVKGEREKIRRALAQSSSEMDSVREKVTQALRVSDS